jgi:carboxyl-terminal processing protease
MKKYMKKILMTVLVISILLTPVNVQADENVVEAKGEEFKALMNLIMNRYVGDEVTEEQLFKAAIDGMFNELDVYSTFYTKKQADKLMETVSGEFVGVGIEIVQAGNWVKVSKPLPKSPAIKAGVKAEDIIIAVNGESTENLTPNETANKIRGEKGTKVSITFKRGETKYTVELVRSVIKQTAVETREVNQLFPKLDKAKAKQIAYIKINSINANVAIDIVPHLLKAKDSGVKYLILDLRDNLGGFVDTGVALCDLLIPKGNILHFVNKEGRKTTFTTDLEEAPFELVVLTNENTASASEFIAAAVKESGAGVTVGENTYGKGVAQYIYSLSDNYGLKLTTEEFLSRDGNKINKIGVAPDYEVIVPNLIISGERLFLNDKLEEVMPVENILKFLGYVIDTPDYVYDEKTEKAITKFQKENKLRAYGVADYPTLKALNKKLVEQVGKKDIQLEKALEVILSKMNKN